MNNTRWEDIYDALKLAGLDVYSPAQHQGDCTSPYVVVKNNGSSPYAGLSSTYTTYDILCYVPLSNYSRLEGFVDEVKEIMSGLYPMIISLNTQTPAFPDDTNKSFMTSIQYKNNKTI